MPLSPADREAMIRTVYGEASNQPPLGQAGIAAAMLNRVAAGGYGDGVQGVVHAPAAGVNPARGFKEFSPWNAPGVPESNPIAQRLSPNDPGYADIGSIVDKVYNGLIPRPNRRRNPLLWLHASAAKVGGSAGGAEPGQDRRPDFCRRLRAGPGQTLPTTFSGGAFGA